MADTQDKDQALFTRLQTVLDVADPIASFVRETGTAAYAWRRVDAELAELLSDSATEAEQLAGVRRSHASVRAVTFATTDLRVTLEIQTSGERTILIGQLSPAAETAVEVQGASGATASAAVTDEFGLFRLELARSGRIRLRVPHPAGAARRPVETSWISIS